MSEELLYKFLHDRSSGANQLAKKEISIIAKLLHTKHSREEIHNFIHRAAKNFPEMAPIKKIEFFFSQHPLNEESVNSFAEKLANEEYIENSEFLFDKMKNILTFSNSSCVRKVLLQYKNRIDKIFCCRSLPLAEGKIIQEKLQKKGIDAVLIEDMEITKYAHEIDFILIGADAIGEKYFINKVGTKLLLLFANYFNLPVYVVSTGIKKFSKSEFAQVEIGEYFERVETEFVTKFIF